MNKPVQRVVATEEDVMNGRVPPWALLHTLMAEVRVADALRERLRAAARSVDPRNTAAFTTRVYLGRLMLEWSSTSVSSCDACKLPHATISAYFLDRPRMQREITGMAWVVNGRFVTAWVGAAAKACPLDAQAIEAAGKPRRGVRVRELVRRGQLNAGGMPHLDPAPDGGAAGILMKLQKRRDQLARLEQLGGT